MNKEKALSILKNRWSLDILELSDHIHIYGLSKWNFINSEIIELIQAIGKIDMIITENLEIIIKTESEIS